MTPATVIALRGVSRRMAQRQVFSAVSLRISRGDIFGIVGPNGSGKTTLLRLMVGLIDPSAGSARLLGLPVKRGLRELRVAYFGGWATLPPMVTAAAWGQLFGVRNRSASAPRRLGELSPGMRQQAGLLAVLERESLDLVVLDEPWDSLDPEASRRLTRLVIAQRAAGATVVLTSNRFHELAGVCSRVGFLVSGTLHELGLADSQPLSADSLLAAYDRLNGA